MKNIHSVFEVGRVFLKLGLSSFGGPIAHIGYFREEFVNRRKWLDEEAFADLVALCQFLPGPASSQVGISIGNLRAGFWGGIASWLGFTMPSAIAMIMFGYGTGMLATGEGVGWIHGLKVVAVAVVAQAVWNMAVNLCPDRSRQAIAIISGLMVLLWHSTLSQIIVILAAGLVGWKILEGEKTAQPKIPVRLTSSYAGAVISLGVFLILLIALPIFGSLFPDTPIDVISSFYRVGSLVFGGGHVVLPLIQAEVVPQGWVTNDIFLAGYGAAQAVPGPLFTFTAFLGTVMSPEPNGWAGGMMCLISIYLPSFLLLTGVLPFWDALRTHSSVRCALNGVNASVVGILLAALYDPVWISAILSVKDFALALGCFGLLTVWKLPPWVIVMLAVSASFLLY